MSRRNWALFAATFVSLIYAANFSIAKDVMPQYITPFAFILVRVLGAFVLFWMFSFLGPKEKIDMQDFPRIAAAALFGVAINQLAFFEGLSLTSPITASVLMVTTPILVLITAALLTKEKIKFKKVLGIVLGLSGTCILILYGKEISNSPRAAWGNFLVFINAASYAVYLIITKKLIAKYHAFTFVKWIYTFGLLMVIPFGYEEFTNINWIIIPVAIHIKIAFVVVFTTFLAYLINLMAMKELKPTTLSVFIYLQPLFATIIAVSFGKDQLSFVTLIAAILIFVGVFLVSHKKQKNTR